MNKKSKIFFLVIVFVLFFVSNSVYAISCIKPIKPAPHKCYTNVNSTDQVGEDNQYNYFSNSKKQVEIPCSSESSEEITYNANLAYYNSCIEIKTSEEKNNIKITLPNTNNLLLSTTCANPYNYDPSNQPAINGMQKAYNIVTGEREDQPTGKLSENYSSYDPINRTDTISVINDNNGNTFKKFSDGTYALYNKNTNLYARITEGTYKTADLKDMIPDIYNSTLKNIESSVCKIRAKANKEKDTIKNIDKIIPPTNSIVPSNTLSTPNLEFKKQNKIANLPILKNIKSISTNTNPQNVTNQTIINKINIVNEPVKQELRWYQKIFNWFKGK
ncbi:MAG: hypothetical protein WCI91_04030 [Candidatus Nomurabacteria bacterium]